MLVSIKKSFQVTTLQNTGQVSKQANSIKQKFKVTEPTRYLGSMRKYAYTACISHFGTGIVPTNSFMNKCIFDNIGRSCVPELTI